MNEHRAWKERQLLIMLLISLMFFPSLYISLADPFSLRTLSILGIYFLVFSFTGLSFLIPAKEKTFVVKDKLLKLRRRISYSLVDESGTRYSCSRKNFVEIDVGASVRALIRPFPSLEIIEILELSSPNESTDKEREEAVSRMEKAVSLGSVYTFLLLIPLILFLIAITITLIGLGN